MKKPRPQVAGFLTVSPHPRENAIVTESGLRKRYHHVNGACTFTNLVRGIDWIQHRDFIVFTTGIQAKRRFQKSPLWIGVLKR